MSKIIKILLGVGLIFGSISCSSKYSHQTYRSITNKSVSKDQMKVRLTTYWSHGAGTDKWTRRGISSTGAPLVERISCAVDPRVIPYGSTVKLPEVGLTLVAVDTGSAVVKKTASRRTGRNEPVVDIYFRNKSDALKFNDTHLNHLICGAEIIKM